MQNTSETRRVGRPSGITENPDKVEYAKEIQEWLDDDSEDFMHKINFLSNEIAFDKLLRNYVLSGKKYECLVCDPLKDWGSKNYRQHIKSVKHLNKEHKVVYGTIV
jgi:hypothetical protein